MKTLAISRQTTYAARLFAALLIAVLAIFTAGTAANAHDQLTGSTPKNESTISESPEQIKLNFSGELQHVEGADMTVVVISNAEGQKFDNELQVKGRDAIATPNQPLPNGEYTVTYRVVSSDGHPIDGTVGFTLEGQAAGSDATETAAAPSTEASDEPGAQDAATQSPEEPATAPQEAAAGISPIVWIIVGVAIFGVAVAVLVNFARRNNMK